MNSATALHAAALALKAAGLSPTPPACAVLAVALFHADGSPEDVAVKLAPHIRSAAADVKLAFREDARADDRALAVALLASVPAKALFAPAPDATLPTPAAPKPGGKKRLPPV